MDLKTKKQNRCSSWKILKSWFVCRFFSVFAFSSVSLLFCICPFTPPHHHSHIHSISLSCSPPLLSSHPDCSWLATIPLPSSLCSFFFFFFLLSKLQTAGRAGTVRPCRYPPASDAPRAEWRGAGHGGSWRRSGRSHLRSCHLLSGCGRRR